MCMIEIQLEHTATQLQHPCPVIALVGVERSQEGDASDENEDAEFFDAMEDSAYITVTASDHTQHK